MHNDVGGMFLSLFTYMYLSTGCALGWDTGTSLSGTAGWAGAPNPAAPRRRSGVRSDTTALMRSIAATERAVAPAGSEFNGSRMHEQGKARQGYQDRTMCIDIHLP